VPACCVAREASACAWAHVQECLLHKAWVWNVL